MKKEILSEFHQLIVDRFGYHEAKHLHLEMGCPHIQLQRLIKPLKIHHIRFLLRFV